MPKNKPLIEDIWGFLKVRKAWWLIPLVLMLILAGMLIVFGTSSSIVSPIIYALF